MPVTSKKILLPNISGAGKKAPNNLRYDHTKKQIVNPKCDCKPPSTPKYPGIYVTRQFFGNAVCNGTNCYSDNVRVDGPEIIAIPGTTYTLQPYVNLFIINPTTSNVYWKNDYDTPTPQLLASGWAAINRPDTPNPVIYTFTSS